MSNESKRKKLSSKYLYTCESRIDAYEYKKMAKYFPKIYWAYVSWGTILNLIVTSTIAILSRNLVATLVSFVVYQLFLMILYKIRLEHFAEKNFNSIQQKGNVDIEFHTEFYEDYFIRQGEIETLKINYNDIERCVETDTNFYLEFNKRNKIIIIQKNTCDLELVNFIRNTFKDLENCLGDGSSFKGVKKFHHPNFIKKGMILLFIITLLSFFGATWTMDLVNKINPQHGFSFTKNNWVFWCWLPIPLLSIIFGFKYKKAGFKCTKNIVGGFIIGFSLLMYGSFCLFPTFSQDYSKIDIYRNIVDAELPDNGELEIQNWETYFEEDKTNYTIINAYYDKEDVSKLLNSIEESDNWILSTEMKSELKALLSLQFKSSKDVYYSLYNKTTNEYNIVPSESGEYEIYVMNYDKTNKQLSIHKFKYMYK